MLTRVDEAQSPDHSAGSRFTLSQIITLMGLLGLVFIALVAGFMAWNERRTLFQEARDHADEAAFFLADHAQRLFEVSDIALRAAAQDGAGKSWDEIEKAPDIMKQMREIDRLLPYIDALIMADETGGIRVTTLDKSPNYSVADRSVFMEAAAHPGDRLLIGEPILGGATSKPTFLIGRRMDNADGSFRGLVAVAMSLSYFTDYWGRLESRNGERVALVRGGDGSILVRYPAATSDNSSAMIGAGVLAAVADRPVSGAFLPAPHEIGSFHRIGNLPIYLAVVYRDAAINAEWLAWLLWFLPFVATAILAVVLVMSLGRRLAAREAEAHREMETAQALLSVSNARLEQRVAERTADLQETNLEIQRFAYIVSHDLRAPLVNIMGFTSELANLRDELFAAPAGTATVAVGTEPDRLRGDFDEALGFIQSSIDKMDRLIKAILSLSRQGQRKFKLETLDMDAVMRSIVDGVAHRVMLSGATITVGSLPPLVADRVAVEQVFSNIIDNAVKYVRPDTPGRIEISGEASATTATFTIRDNGRGIDPKDRERVFELFRRAGRQDQPGEGIGLANVRSLVRRLEGTIALDSTLGSGSVFTVTLPKFGADDGPRE